MNNRDISNYSIFGEYKQSENRVTLIFCFSGKNVGKEILQNTSP